MVSSETYQFTSGDGTQGAQVKGIDKGYLCLPNVPSSKSASWGHLNELELLNSAGRNLQGPTQLPSSACMTFSNGLGGVSVGQNMDGREGQMGTYFTGSNVQGEVMQTLHLMNPHYSGYADTVSHADNMILVNSSAVVGGQENSLTHHSQLQQQYLGFSTSSSLTQSAQQPMLSNVYDSPIVTQANPQQSSLFLNRFGNNTWTTGNELSFLRSSDTARITQPLAARMACMEPGQQQPNSSLSQLIARPHQALHDEHNSVLQHGISLGLATDNPQASPGSNQVLSLSLSAHHNPLQIQCYGMQPDAVVLNSCQGLLHGSAEDTSGDDGYSHNWIGNTNQLRASSHGNQLGPAYHDTALNSSNRQLEVEASVQAIPGIRGYLIGSKYLRAAQLLLEEVVGLGCGIKNSPKPTKLQAWMTGTSLLDSSSQKEENAGSETPSTAKEAVACVVPAQNVSSGTEQNLAVAITERNLQENQELQLKKAKLMAMLDEVDRRYKLYFSQMEAVVNTFESAAGLGAAKTYTALALQTISKHFRGLRDAIGGQIQAASRALGEEDSSLLGLGRLRYVDQQLRQQRALQQLGMMQQHAWRPQRGLPERAVSVLRAWLFEHFLHPYPKDADKHMLARQTGLSRNQVSNWFINARVRLWKPMVEEMYLEELKDGEVDRTSAETSADQKSNTENSDNHRSGISGMDDQGGAGVPETSNKQGWDEVGSKDVGSMQADKQMVPSYHHMGANMLQHASSLNGGNAHLLQGIIKPRSAGVVDAYGQGFKAEDYGREEEFESQDKHSFAVREMDPNAFGNYHDQGEGFAAIPAGYNGVSLTLGLQHSDGVSLAGAQQQSYYLPPQQQNLQPQSQIHLQNQGVTSGLFSQLAMSGSRRRLDEVEDYYPSMDGPKNYDALTELQTRKRFASNMYNQG